MALQLGDIAPDFEADTTEGRIKFHDYIGNGWVVFVSHPMDFTPLCTTELGYMAKIKLIITYPMSTGRNFDEVLRVIDSLQLTATKSVATPANWKQGDDVIILPSVSDEAAKEKFPGGWKTLKPYLRLVPQP